MAEIGWTFLTNYAAVLVRIAQTPDMTVREIAEKVRITERSTHRILKALVDERYISRRRVGRNNFYFVNRDRRLRHPEFSHIEIHRLLDAVAKGP